MIGLSCNDICVLLVTLMLQEVIDLVESKRLLKEDIETLRSRGEEQKKNYERQIQGMYCYIKRGA